MPRSRSIDPLLRLALSLGMVPALLPAAPAYRVLTTITVGSEATQLMSGIGVNPLTNRIYVPNYNSNNISVIDGTRNIVIGTIKVTKPQGVDVDPITNRLFVTNAPVGIGVSTLTVIDLYSDSVLATLTMDENPFEPAVNAFTHRVYVSNNFGTGILDVVDGLTDRVASTVAIGTNPSGVAVDPFLDRVYTTLYGFGGGNTVQVLNGATNTIVNSITGLPSAPWMIALNPFTHRAYVTECGPGCGNSISVLDTSADRVVTTILVGNGPYGVAVNPISNVIFGSNYNDGTVSVIDGTKNTVTQTLKVGTNPEFAAFDSVTLSVYVANSNDGTVSVLAAFAGTPGQTNCVGQSVSALTSQYHGISAASAAFGFPSVFALQETIAAFCGPSSR
jgi:YVTN family beta-propeller protein